VAVLRGCCISTMSFTSVVPESPSGPDTGSKRTLSDRSDSSIVNESHPPADCMPTWWGSSPITT